MDPPRPRGDHRWVQRRGGGDQRQRSQHLLSRRRPRGQSSGTHLPRGQPRPGRGRASPECFGNAAAADEIHPDGRSRQHRLGLWPPGQHVLQPRWLPGYRVDLFAGATLLARDANSLAAAIPEGEFRTTTLPVDIGQSHPALDQPLSVWLVNLNQAGPANAPGIEVDFDDVRLVATPLPTCPADFDGDGTVDFFDYDAFVTCFEGNSCPPGITADFDHDGTVDFFDYDAFVVAFETPC